MNAGPCLFNQEYYILADSTVDWDTAKAECEKRQMELASIHNEAQEEKVEGILSISWATK